ncbi:hypothetical protein [Fluviicola taffensis]|uniref:Uncharacterized protein n=1 Tax=Fluviicola taffensis (strain DSM 16823 / NCIMB 13979 / RW262) TaxID=755732 RepID=F2IF69_FLUTR|nr:hypothetical protein [Fluviicola taffensis]AEA43543.1 hypothetical protein Fluta_1551 [Fluviicola taffensis DSM 16823]
MKYFKSLGLLFFASILLNTAFAQKTPLVGGIETISFKFTESSIQLPVNYEVTINQSTIEIVTEKYTESGVEKSKESKKISKKDWAKLCDLAGKLQESGTYYPEGGTGYQTYELIRKNAGTIQSYILIWTSLTENKVDKTTQDLVTLIKSLTPRPKK